MRVRMMRMRTRTTAAGERLHHRHVNQVARATPFLHGFGRRSRPLLLNAGTVTQMAFLASIRGIARSGHVKQLRASTFKAITRPFTKIFNLPTATTHFTDTPLSHDPGDASGSLVIITVTADASTPKARTTL